MTDKNQEDTEKKAAQPSEENISEDLQEISGEGNAVLNAEELDTLGEIGNIFMGSASTTLSTLLNQKVQITTPEVDVLDTITKIPEINKPSLVVEINYTEGLNGNVMLVIGQKEAAIISDLMMGGSGAPSSPELDEIKVSAVQEAMNQMVGNASTVLSSMFNMSINISPPDVRLSDNDPGLPVKDIVALKFNFKIGDIVESDLYQFIQINAAKTQVEKIIAVTKGMTETIANNISPQSIMDDLVKQGMDSFQQQSDAPNSGNAFSEGQQANQNQVTVQPVQFASFDNSSEMLGKANQNLNLVMDVNLGLTVELGKAELPIKNVLELTRGSIIELDKVAGEPVELYANGKLIAKGEVVVIEDNFGLRITSIVSPEQRIKHL